MLLKKYLLVFLLSFLLISVRAEDDDAEGIKILCLNCGGYV